MKQKADQANKTSASYHGKAPHFRVRRSLFKKYLIFGISILLTSFIALSVTMYSFVNQYWEEQKKASLLDNAHQVADAITSYSSIIPSVHSLVIDEHSLVGLTVISISKSVDADILITDNKGICLYCSEDGSCIHKTRAFPSKASWSPAWIVI